MVAYVEHDNDRSHNDPSNEVPQPSSFNTQTRGHQSSMQQPTHDEP